MLIEGKLSERSPPSQRDRFRATLRVARAAPVVASGEILRHHLTFALGAAWRGVIPASDVRQDARAVRLGYLSL
jgi:hypothetical protein